MHRSPSCAAATAIAIVTSLAACAPKPAEPAQSPVERGRYLVTIGGCDDCHTPKVFTAAGMGFDSTRRLSGHPSADTTFPAVPRGLIGPTAWGTIANNHLTAWRGPWGTSFTANLTPDGTGLENWTDSIFVLTMRTGRHMGSGRQILPPMPWFNYAAMTDDDLRAVFAFLRSLPPVANQVPAPLPPS